MKDYLNGIVDMHLHLNPSVSERFFDLVEMAEIAKKAGYKAFLYKEHFLNTAPMTSLIQKRMFPDMKPIIMGSTVLNNAMGGLNPEALKAAIKFGAKIAWLPTSSAKQHWSAERPKPTGKPRPVMPEALEKMEKLGMTGKPMANVFGSRPDNLITLTDEGGELKAEVVEILKITRDTPDFLLSSGHA